MVNLTSGGDNTHRSIIQKASTARSALPTHSAHLSHRFWVEVVFTAFVELNLTVLRMLLRTEAKRPQDQRETRRSLTINLERNFKENLRHELPSLELKISLKPMELFRTYINSVPEDEEHHQILIRKKEFWNVFSEVRGSLYDRLVVRSEFQNHLSIALCNVFIGKVIFQD